MTTALLHFCLQRARHSLHDQAVDLRVHAVTLLSTIGSLLVRAALGIELSLASLGCVVGIFLMLPLHTFGSAEGYHVMAEFAPEVAWGYAFFLSGLGTLIGLIVESRSLRRLAALNTLGMWAFISYCLIAASPRYLATALFPTLAVLSFWAYVRIGK